MRAPNPTLAPIHVVRGRRVMLDSDLARLYGVATKVFNQTIRRNLGRFPPDFLFELTAEELANLKSQFVTSSPVEPPALRSQIVTLKDHGGRRYVTHFPVEALGSTIPPFPTPFFA